MSIFEQQTPCNCNKPDCYFCWLRNKVYTTTALEKTEDHTKEPEPYDILVRVSEASGVTIEDIAGRLRKENIVIARQMFCYVARIHLKKTGVPKWQLHKIGSVINRDHSSVLHSCAVVENMMETRHPEYISLGVKLGIS